jgi:flagellar motor switch protein FliM
VSFKNNNMAKKETIVVKDLRVKVTYTVGYGNVEMPKSMYKKLLKAAEKGDSMAMGDIDDSMSWLLDNIQERDAYSWEAEIEDISEHKV